MGTEEAPSPERAQTKQEECEALLNTPRLRLAGGRRLHPALVAAGSLLAVVGALGLLHRRGSPAAGSMPEVVEVVRDDGEFLSLKDENKETCSGIGENCNVTKCCKVKGTQCYMKKDRFWAMCRPSCHPGPDPADVDRTPWKCHTLGERAKGHYTPPVYPPQPAAWVAQHCSAQGENCTASRCCKDKGYACYTKAGEWAACKAACTPGPDPTDADSTPWECKQLGMRTPGLPHWPDKTADWVKEECSKEDEDCTKSRCCVEAGMQCFKKNDHTAKCIVGCVEGVHMEDENDHPWNCTPLGGRTPGIPKMEQRGPGKWVKEKCAKTASENCHQSKCCKEPGMQCYEDSEEWAGCLPSCTEWKKLEVNGPLRDQTTNKSWSCKRLGERTPREWGTPSLFCFSVFRLNNEEADLMRNQLFRGIGIFGCDNYALFSADRNADLGDGPLGPLKTVYFKPAPVGVTKDGTAGNTQLFMNVWETVRWDGRYRTTDWTIKADPDAVIIPARLRSRLQVHTGHPSFVLTCGKAGMPDGPMMFGSVEAISTQALDAYFSSESTCRSLPWQSWGEDLWMGNCLKALGVSAEGDYNMVSDGVCLYANCGDHNAAAYHPFKTVEKWMQCYYGATR